MADTCAACGTAPQASSARWCGHCGARLDAPTRRHARRAAEAGSDHALVGAGSTTVLVDEAPDEDGTTADARTWSPRARLAAAAGVLLVLVAVLLVRPEPEVTYEARGFTARGDAGRSGTVSLAPLEAPARVAWAADVGGPARTTSRVRSAGDLVLEQTGGGLLAVREAATGEVRWLRRDIAAVGLAIRVGDVVVVTAEAGPLRAFAVADGRERWRLDDLGGAPVEPVGDTLVVRSDGQLWAVAAATGEVRWQLDERAALGGTVQDVVPGGAGVGVWITSPPGLSPDAARVSHHIALLDPATGAVRFTRDLPFPHMAAPLAVGGRHVAWADEGGLVVAGPDGEVVHRIPERNGTALVASGDLLAFTPWDGGVVGLDLRTGTERWSRPDVTSPWLVAADGLVVAANGTVIDASTGRTLSVQRRLSLDAIAGETTLLSLPAITGSELEVRDRAGSTVTVTPLIPDETDAPAAGAGRVFVPTREGVEAYRVADGERDWAFAQLPTGAGLVGGHATARTPVVGDRTVLVSPGRGFGGGPGLVALELGGGVRAWDREGDRPTVRGPLTLAGDVAFVPVRDEVHGYDVATGRRAFAAVAGTELGPLVVGPNRVIGGSTARDGVLLDTEGEPVADDGEAVAILRRDRSVNWRSPLRPCSGPVLAGERVAWGTADGVTALDERTGEPAWQLATPRPVCLDPVVADGHLVVVEEPSTIHAVPAAEGGRPAWSTELSAPAVASPVVAGGVLLVPLVDGTLAAHSLTDGAQVWSFDLGGIPDASPTVLDGHVLVHLSDGRLVALAP